MKISSPQAKHNIHNNQHFFFKYSLFVICASISRRALCHSLTDGLMDSQTIRFVLSLCYDPAAPSNHWFVLSFKYLKTISAPLRTHKNLYKLHFKHIIISQVQHCFKFDLKLDKTTSNHILTSRIIKGQINRVVSILVCLYKHSS